LEERGGRIDQEFSDKEVSQLVGEVKLIFKNLPKSAKEKSPSPYAKVGYELFDLFHQIGLKYNFSSEETSEVNRIIESFIKERFDWLITFFYRIRYDFLNKGYDPNKVEIICSGIRFLLNHIDKSSVEYKQLQTRFKLIEGYISKRKEIVSKCPDWDKSSEDLVIDPSLKDKSATEIYKNLLLKT
jgi:hypothetical protein